MSEDTVLETEAPKRRRRRNEPKAQVTAQLPGFAAQINRELAVALTTSPKVVLAAAVLAFELLDPSIQVDMVNKARVRALESR